MGDAGRQIDLDWLANAVQLRSDLAALRQPLVRQLLGGGLPATAEARTVLGQIKGNEPQDLTMLSAGLAEIRRLLVFWRA